jgi:hypothetical protein
MRMAMSMLSRNFRIQHAGDPADVRERFGFTMMPQAVPVHFSVWVD